MIKMDNFPIVFSFDKTVGNVNGRIEVFVSESDTLFTALEEACRKMGIVHSEHFQVNNLNGVFFDINGTIEQNGITKDCQLLIIEPGRESCIYRKYNNYKSTTDRLWMPLAIVGILLSVVGLIIVIVIYVISASSIYSYSVVIDAGSTSSKVYLYSWPANKFSSNADVSQVATCKTESGVSSYEENPDRSFDEIKQCLDDTIVPMIPQDKKSKSYIFLGATAGMRMLRYKNSNASNYIMTFLRQSLSKYALKINNTKTDVAIIPGSLEGLTGWITVNFLLDTFPKTGGSVTSVIGAMDMGGASTQITFMDSSANNSSGINTVKLYGKSYQIYSHSYLCYGKSEAELRFLAVLLFRKNFEFNVSNPCMDLGERATFAIGDIFFKPCVFGKFALDHYGYEIVPPQNLIKENATFTFIGTSNYSQCHILVNSLFNDTKCNGDPNCTFNGVYQPKISGKFGVFSAYLLIKDNLNPNNLNFDLTRYKLELLNRCNNRSKIYDSGEDKYAKYVCFDLTFLIEVLVQLGFTDSNWKDISFIKTIKDYYIGWSLGYMIEKTALLPKEQHLLPMDGFIFGILIAVLILILIFAMIFMLLTLRGRGHFMYRTKVNCDGIEEQNLLSTSRD